MKSHVIKFFRQSGARHDLRFLWLGAAIGFVAAWVSIAFREGIAFVSRTSFGVTGDAPFWEGVAHTPTWRLILVPVVIGAFVPYITRKIAPDAKGHGVPELMYAVAIKRGVIGWKFTLLKFWTSVISIGSGFSVGREGPSALVGAGTASFFGQLIKLPTPAMKMVVGCGAAAGIAATFNAPLGGTCFALELVIANYNIRNITSVFMAAIMATVVSHRYFGNNHELFSNIQFSSTNPMDLIAYALLGALVGVAGIAFVKGLYKTEDFADELAAPDYIKGALGGLGVGLLLIFCPRVTGPSNWSGIHEAISTSPDAKIALLFLGIAIAKMLATAWSVSFGGSGGIFAPSLMIGSYLGSSFGYVGSNTFSSIVTKPSGFALVGMGAFVASVTQAPLTAITLSFEMTNNMSILLPLVISAGIALGVYNHYMPGSIYTLKLQRRGLNLEWGRETGVLENIPVSKVLTAEDEFLTPDLTVQMAVDSFSESTRSSLPVVADGVVVGVLSLWDIRRVARNPDQKFLPIKDLMLTDYSFVTADQNLYDAFSIISHGDFEYLPVVESAANRKLVGRVSRQRVLQTYKNQLTLKGIITS